MCGIVGYVGSREAEPILIEGLRRLEYRGYDSAGLAFLENQKFRVIRAEGKLDSLVAKLKKESSRAHIGIGHTRWATHGKPSETNAHPHHSQDVVLVHNGIIENFYPLKRELLAKGFEFVSETDTEVVCHLIQDSLNNGQNFIQSFRSVLERIRGAFSFVALHRLTPDKIFVAKRGSPLVLGVKPGEAFVASDIPALLSHTREMFFMEDGETAVLSREGIEFADFDGKKTAKRSRHIPWTAAQAEKGGYKHFMLKEILEQPRAFADTLSGRVDPGRGDVAFEPAETLLRKFAANPRGRLQIVACGTSWHAGLVGKYWIESLAKLPVQVDLSSEFRYREMLVDEETLVVPISQSGETADTLAVVKECRNKGAKILSVCNVIESSIPRASDATLYTYAGPEIGVASTKAFVTQMAVLYLLALKLAVLRQTLTSEEVAGRLQALLEMPKILENFMQTGLGGVETIVEKIYKEQHCYFSGRGIQYPIVLEGALKLKEISYVHAEGYAGGEMKHGPIALIEEGIPVIVTLLDDGLREKMLSNVEEVKARGANVFLLISAGDDEIKNKFSDVIEIPRVHPDLAPFLAVVPLQLIAYHAADRKGTDVDQPRNLAKSVTVK